MNPIKDVVIVGGGTAGLISALYIKKFYPQFNLKIVKSKEIGIIGVGEGSTEHWNQFLLDCDLDFKEVIVKTDATIKIGILFNDWSFPKSSYVHSVAFSPGKSKFGILEFYNQFILNNKTNNPYILSGNFYDIFYQNKIPLNSDLKSSNQYHFDTFKLNKYLTDKCIERDINIIDSLVKDVTLDQNGNIVNLVTKKKLIKGDFFVDCSGFKRVLSSKLDSKWISYNQYLPMNHAITLGTDLNHNYIEPYTKCTALSSGWVWKIPTQTRYGNGYVFDDRYINSDKALNEFNQHLGTNIEKTAKDIKFEAGRINKFWIKNCVSIGLAGSFAEPLEAQSIGFSIIQSNTLVEFLNSWIFDKNQSEVYNKSLIDSFDNTINYLQLHYFTQRNDSKFWQEKPFKITEFNKNTLKRFSHGVFLNQDFSLLSMFKEENFYQVYYGIGLLSKDKILSQSNNLCKSYNDFHKEVYKNEWEPNSQIHPNLISHINYLKLIKENYSS